MTGNYALAGVLPAKADTFIYLLIWCLPSDIIIVASLEAA